MKRRRGPARGPVVSSQRYLDEEIVAAKLTEQDYTVSCYEIELGGIEYRVVIDGHHSLVAAMRAGAEPDWEPVASAVASEYAHEIAAGGAEAWLDAHRMDSDYYDVNTGRDVF